MLHAPAALISLIDERRQFFKSSHGLGEPWKSLRETPLSHSFCQHAVRDKAPLVVEDAREHPVLKDNLAIGDLHVIAYAGVPLFVENEAIGAFCVVDDQPRIWSAEELELLTDLAASVVSEIELRLALRAAEEQRMLTDALLDGLGDGVLAIDRHRKFLIVNSTARKLFAAGPEIGQSLPPNWSTLHRSVLPDGSLLASEDGALPRALSGEPTNGLEFSLEPSGAKAVWVEATGRPVRNGDGEVIAAVAVYRDVTERKRQVDLFAALAHNIPRGTVVLFDEQLRCLAIDGEMARSEGVALDQALGRSMRELAGEAGGQSFDAVEDAYRRTLAGESLTLDFTYRNRTLVLRTSPVRDGLGRITSGIVLALDVSQQRHDHAAVQRSEQLYRLIVQNLPNGAVFMVNRDLRFLSADGSALGELADLMGTSRHDLVGHTVEEVVPAPNRDATVQLLRSALGNEPQRIEVAFGGRHYELLAEPIPDLGTAAVSSVLLFCIDITDHKRAHDAVSRERAALSQFRAFVEYISIGITVMHAGLVTYMNPAMLRMLGYDDGSVLLGRPVASLIHEDDRDSVSARVAAAETVEIAPRRTQIYRRDGSLVTLETIARPFEFDGAPSVVAASRDMTAEINAEAARRDHTAMLETFRLMVEVVRDYAIFQLDPQGRVRTWNAGARAIKGYEANEIIGAHVRIFYPPEDQTKSDLKLTIAADEGRYEEEGWRVRKDGTRFWASVIITALRDPNDQSLSGYVKVTRDLTERKQVEDAQVRSLAEKTAMLQEIHHRVKNNLQMISSLLNLQARQIKDPDARAIFLDTQSRVRSIALLHESLYQSDDLGRVDMQEYVGRLVATLHRAYGEASPCARFSIDVELVFLPLDMAVPCGLIINELVTNSLKHAFNTSRPRDENEIQVGMRTVLKELVLTVADNGVGFGRPFDAHAAETMGVMLVSDLSLQLDGKLEFQDDAGARCTVRFASPQLEAVQR